MRQYIYIILLMSCVVSNAQDSLTVEEDNRYREDQFYASITYNLLTDNPAGVSQSNFSTGFHFGVIRDMPINKRRNWAIGLGLGISSNSYNQNLVITEGVSGVNYDLEDDLSLGNVSKNKFTTYLIDIPFELRWRTSTPSTYKFWRIYPGFKISYVLFNSSKLRSDVLNNKISNNDDFNTLQYGITLSAGYGTWNFQLYYGLNPIFDDSAQLNANAIDSRAVRVGIIFYIL